MGAFMFQSLETGLKTLAVLSLLAVAPAMADEQTYWAEQNQNTFADLIKLPVVNQFDTDYGHKAAVKYTLAFQPSMVSEFSKGWNIVNRLNVPFIYQPGRTQGEKDSHGLGNIVYESFIGPSNGRNVFWGIGPTFQIPTQTDKHLGSTKWSAGIAGAVSFVKGPIVAGARINQLWSFAGSNASGDMNQTTIEYFVYANLGSGWWIGTSPINVANWESSSDERWTIPLGGGFGKVVGKRLPVNLKLEAYSYAEAPPGAGDWTVLLGVDFLIPESSLFKR
ncbi:hypothetical protein P4C99_03115 [Pontiellaceae bacterium B1224]|nr:hypothetical protein [Pontiellaceae bacterium B1224]